MYCGEITEIISYQHWAQGRCIIVSWSMVSSSSWTTCFSNGGNGKKIPYVFCCKHTSVLFCFCSWKIDVSWIRRCEKILYFFCLGEIMKPNQIGDVQGWWFWRTTDTTTRGEDHRTSFRGFLGTQEIWLQSGNHTKNAVNCKLTLNTCLPFVFNLFSNFFEGGIDKNLKWKSQAYEHALNTPLASKMLKIVSCVNSMDMKVTLLRTNISKKK